MVPKYVHREMMQAKLKENIVDNSLESTPESPISLELESTISYNIAALILYSFFKKAETENMILAII